jgi:DNA-binding PadR family transcriptional regulator
MSILEHLIKNTNISFSELLEITQLSPGNLYSHCQILENSGYIIKNKIISGDRPQSMYNITQEGLNSLKFYSLQLSTYLSHLVYQINLTHEYNRHRLPPFQPHKITDPEGHEINLVES